jgi:hypothetical protein
MGGQLAVTIRLKDGTERRMERWTNIIPNLMQNVEFMEGNEQSSKAFIEQWDTEIAKKDHGKTIISTWGMYKRPYLAPSEYGIILIDFKTMTIVSCQPYFGVDDVIMNAKHETNSLLGTSYQDKITYLGDEVISFKINQSLWKIHELEYDVKGMITAKSIIKKLGFKLSKKEQTIWKTKFVEMRE